MIYVTRRTTKMVLLSKPDSDMLPEEQGPDPEVKHQTNFFSSIKAAERDVKKFTNESPESIYAPNLRVGAFCSQEQRKVLVVCYTRLKFVFPNWGQLLVNSTLPHTGGNAVARAGTVRGVALEPAPAGPFSATVMSRFTQEPGSAQSPGKHSEHIRRLRHRHAHARR